MGVNRVLLAGVGRSGTTWTGRILGCAADTGYVNEPDNIGVNHSTGPQNDTLGFGPYPVLRAGQNAPQYEALWRMAWSGRLPMRVGLGRRVARLGLKLPPVVRDPLLSAFAGAVEGTRKPPANVVVKSTMTQFALEWIVENFHPRVVIIQRNPLNVVSSWLAWKELITRDLDTRPAIQQAYVDLIGEEPPTPGGSQLELTAWCVGLLTTILAKRREQHPDWHVITHEALCAEPAQEFHQLFDALGLTWTEEADGFLQKGYLLPTFAKGGQVKPDVAAPPDADPLAVSKEQASRWKKRLSDDQVADISRVLELFPSRGWVLSPEAAAAR